MWIVHSCCLCTGTLLLCLTLGDLSWSPLGVLRSKPMRAIGRISYGVYLYHLPIFEAVVYEHRSWGRVSLALLLTFATATVSYLALEVVAGLLRQHGLEAFDVEELPTHGGSLRVYARHVEDQALPPSPAVEELLLRERAAGLRDLARYDAFEEQVRATKRDLLQFLIGAREEGRRVVGYGAPGKGSTLLNYCGVRADLLEFTVDRSPHKQGRFLPGTRIPICSPDRIRETRPDYVLILPWNLRDEIVEQMAYVREWGGRFVLPVPRVEILA